MVPLRIYRYYYFYITHAIITYVFYRYVPAEEPKPTDLIPTRSKST